MASGSPVPAVTPHGFSALAARVVAAPQGGWVAVLDLGDGATLSKWFPSEGEARRYPHELAEWLNRRSRAL